MKQTKEIDSNVWVTQLALANELSVSIQRVHNWVRRGKIEYMFLPGSRIKLVNKNSITLGKLS